MHNIRREQNKTVFLVMTMGMDALKLLSLGHLKLDIPSQGIGVYVMTCCGPLLGQKFFKH